MQFFHKLCMLSPELSVPGTLPRNSPESPVEPSIAGRKAVPTPFLPYHRSRSRSFLESRLISENDERTWS